MLEKAMATLVRDRSVAPPLRDFPPRHQGSPRQTLQAEVRAHSRICTWPFAVATYRGRDRQQAERALSRSGQG